VSVPATPQFDTLKRAVRTAIFPVLNVAAIVMRTGSAVAAITVPTDRANEIPLLAVITRVPDLVGTVVSTDNTVGVPITNAASTVHVAVALLIVSAAVSIGPKSANRTSVSLTCLHIVPSKSTQESVIALAPLPTRLALFH